ncbi:glycosyltransferase family 4 protein [Bacillus sp. BHET2]|uniref:glycosyltransferase family 4 protein n=1 Tax=Bacillus sp. BHET2 TaxID=2583818 RepID=UPI00110D90F2|nr:glycosyltransferase family 4 protein [Bacillus sp. BHET2]TMU84337.1 glycosyltransferase family 4 protein [Bacillus sp. BHET2]
MKIIQFITRMDDVGGAQVHVLDLSLSLKEAGHEVIVLSMGSGPVTDELQEHGVRCVELSHLQLKIHPVQDGRALNELCRWLRKLKPDIMATHSSKAGMLGRIAGKICNVPTLFTAHGWAFSEGVPERKGTVYRMLERVAGKISMGVITVSRYDYQLALKHKVMPESKMRTIHNSVPDIPMPLTSKPWGSTPKIIMVARFAFPKDHLQLLRALENIKDLPWELNLVGDGPLLTTLKDRVERSPIADRVHFLGKSRNIPELLAGSHIFVLTSKHEGLPISIIEGMRSGLPIVASDVGGINELVEDGHNGFLIPSDDSDRLSQRLKKLIQERQLMEKMGQMSRKQYEEHFTFEHMRDQTVKMYNDVLEKHFENRRFVLSNNKREV